MLQGIRVELASSQNFEILLKMIAEYQRFYSVEPDSERNRTFFSELMREPERGVQFLAKQSANEYLGFATIYFPNSSLSAGTSCLLNDLYTISPARGQGVGKRLIQECSDYAKTQGFTSLEWVTQKSNDKARRLYDSLNCSSSEWIHYEMKYP